MVQILAEGRHQQTHIGIVVNLKDLDFVDVCFFHFHWSSMLFGTATRECFWTTVKNRNFRLSAVGSLVYAPFRKAWNEAARANQHEQPISRRL